MKVWSIVPGLAGVGYGQLIGTASVVSYYCSLIALSLHFLASSLQPVLPWTVCHPALVQEHLVCLTSSDNTSVLAHNQSVISPAEQYFIQGVLKAKDDISDGIGTPDLELTICLAVCWVLLFLTLWKGVASSGKVAYFTAIFPNVTLIPKPCPQPFNQEPFWRVSQLFVSIAVI